MNTTQPVPGLTRVPTWPRLIAELHGDTTGTLTVNGTSRACAAESIEALRTGLIARAVSYAVQLRRPVRLDVTEAAASYQLAVRPGRVVIGREPIPKDGQHAVTVVSPGRQLSRTHAAIEVDQDAQIIVTDLNAPNGVELLTTPPRWLTPGEPTVVPIGAKLMLGDVECIVTLA